MDARRFGFLYRQGEGAIDARTWWAASWPPAAIIAVLTLVWLAIAPRQARDLAHEAFFSAGVVATFAYFIAYVFALLLWAVVQYFVSAKRFADRGYPPACAGLLPLALLLTGAANWYQPRSEGAMPAWATLAFDAAALGVVVWNVWELGFRAGAGDKAATNHNSTVSH